MVLFPIGILSHRSPPLWFHLASIMRFVLPLCLLVGVVSGLICIVQPRRVFGGVFSLIGLVLNVLFLAALVWVAFGFFSGGLSA